MYFQTESGILEILVKAQSKTRNRSDSTCYWTTGELAQFQLGESKCKTYIVKFLTIMQSTPRGKIVTNQEHYAKFGNLKQISIYSQNIIGRGSNLTKQLEVEQILNRQKPDVLVLSEIASAEVEKMSLQGYSHVAGYLSGGKNSPRVSVLIKSHFLYEPEYHDGAEVPHVGVAIKLPEGSYYIWWVYREWDYDKGPQGEENDMDNELDDEFDEDVHVMSDEELEADLDESEGEEDPTPTPQTEIWKTFLEMWMRKARRYKRSVLLGDLNFCYVRDRYGDKKIKESAREYLEGGGWEQMISREMRFCSNAQPSCLDQIWINGAMGGSYRFLYNKSVCSSDLNLVGVSLRTMKKVTTSKKVRSRRWKAVDWG